MALIDYEIELILTWSKNCVVLSNVKDDIAATEINAANFPNVKPAANVLATATAFELTDTKLYV